MGVGIRSWKLRIAGAAKWINKGVERSAIGERNIGFIVGDVTLVCFSCLFNTGGERWRGKGVLVTLFS